MSYVPTAPRDSTITFRLASSGRARIDELRGGWTRSEWVRQAVKRAAGKDNPLRGPQ